MKTIITLLVLILVAWMGIAYLLVILKKADSFPEAVTLVLNKFVEGGKFYGMTICTMGANAAAN